MASRNEGLGIRILIKKDEHLTKGHCTHVTFLEYPTNENRAHTNQGRDEAEVKLHIELIVSEVSCKGRDRCLRLDIFKRDLHGCLIRSGRSILLQPI